MGVNGAGKSTLLKLVAGAARTGRRRRRRGVGVKMGYFAQHAMELLDGERTVFPVAGGLVPPGGRFAARAGRLLRLFGRRRREEMPGAFRRPRRRGWSWRGCSTTRELPRAGRATNHLDLAQRKWLIERCRNTRAPCCSVSARPRFLGGAVQSRARTDARGRAQLRRRLYGILARTGHEASRLARLGAHPSRRLSAFRSNGIARTERNRSKPKCWSKALYRKSLSTFFGACSSAASGNIRQSSISSRRDQDSSVVPLMSTLPEKNGRAAVDAVHIDVSLRIRLLTSAPCRRRRYRRRPRAPIRSRSHCSR